MNSLKGATLAAVLAAAVGLPVTAARAQLSKGATGLGALHDWQWFNDTGWRAYDRGDYARAASSFRQAVEVLRPLDASYRGLLARSYLDFARALIKQKRFDDAEPLARWAVAVREGRPDTKPPQLAEAQLLLAEIEVAQRKHAEAEALLERALIAQQRALGWGHPDLVATIEALAAAEGEQGKADEAELHYKRALALREEVSAERAKKAESLEKSAELLRQIIEAGAVGGTATVKQAERLEHEARAARETMAESTSAATTTQRYATVVRRLGRADEADSLDARARAIRDAVETRAARARAGR